MLGILVGLAPLLLHLLCGRPRQDVCVLATWLCSPQSCKLRGHAAAAAAAPTAAVAAAASTAVWVARTEPQLHALPKSLDDIPAMHRATKQAPIRHL